MSDKHEIRKQYQAQTLQRSPLKPTDERVLERWRELTATKRCWQCTSSIPAIVTRCTYCGVMVDARGDRPPGYGEASTDDEAKR